MKYVLILIDILTVFFSTALALQLGSKYQPNLPVFVICFFGLRLLLQWLFFGSFVHRAFPVVRSIAQFSIFLIALPFVLFLLTQIPGATNFLEQPFYFYYLVVPAVVLVCSLLFSLFFKLEHWQT